MPADAIISKQAKRSGTALFCQAIFAKFYKKVKDRGIYRHGRTVPMKAAVFLCYHSGVDPGGDHVRSDKAQERRVISQ